MALSIASREGLHPLDSTITPLTVGVLSTVSDEADEVILPILEVVGSDPGLWWLRTMALSMLECPLGCGDALRNNFALQIWRRSWASDPSLSELLRRVSSGTTVGAINHLEGPR